MQQPAVNRLCTGRLSNLIPLLRRSFRTSRHYNEHRAATQQQQKAVRRKKDGGQIGVCLLFITLGRMWTGRRIMARDSPHVLSCVNRRQFSH